MKEITCPKCGSTFSKEDADYASIANHVRNEEFNSEVDRRVREMSARKEAEKRMALAEADRNHHQQMLEKERSISYKDVEIRRLKGEINALKAQAAIEKSEAAVRENGVTHLMSHFIEIHLP